MIGINLSESEYESLYNAIKYITISDVKTSMQIDKRKLNVVLLKLLKSKYPDYMSSVGPWDNVEND